ncbi:E3 UFM1-protein ligase 1 [Amphibalanus amphitrite]|uniref:E3 UFM1-protein ligase 1 homolog n=1 Tax=Amphibalanus amphitrite TaxID=1232801 RepID=A0A6A4WXB4_AMPAM|nr:E3 UFM1-protein ligase 1 [Amphibalanus amphitrite]
MGSDWDEIKRLAADLQRAQLLSTAQRLSERNCIEIVTKLVELGLLDVVHTSTGKEYITPEQISREIRDELIVSGGKDQIRDELIVSGGKDQTTSWVVSGGRIGLPELSQTLNVDFSHVEARVQKLVNEEKTIFLVNGYVINNVYLDCIAEEVNEKLQQVGEISIGALTTQYDLPSEFLERELLRRTGSIIRGQPDPDDRRTLFTEAFVAQNWARVRGALSAITRPVTVLQLLQRHNIKEQLFFSVVSDLLSSGRLKGSLTGGRTAVRAVFIPECYTSAQNAFVDHQYRQNGCIEYEALRRVGITDPEAFIKRRFKDEPLRYLSNCAVGDTLVEQVKVSLEEAALAGSFVDVVPLLPASLSAEDVSQLLESCRAGHVFADSVVVSERLLDQLRQPLEDAMAGRAKQDIESGRYPPKQTTSSNRIRDTDDTKRDRKDDRRKKAAGGKAGGGTQGRETKTKSTKKKYMKKGHESDSEDERPAAEDGRELPFLSVAELEESLAAHPALEDAPEELAPDIARFLYRPLTKKYQEVLMVEHQAVLANAGQARRRNFGDFQDKVACMALNIRLFQKGAADFAPDTSAQLLKHLQRTLCTELVNELFQHAAADNNVQYDENKELSAEARVKILNKLPQDMAPDLLKLHKALTAAELSDFDAALEPALATCGVMLKKQDRKKDRQQQRAHVQCLLEQLAGSTDSALTLHLAALVLYQTFTGNMLHASGKFVPAIVSRLTDLVPAEVLSVLQECQGRSLQECQGLVMKQLKLKEADPQRSEVNQQLEQVIPRVKELAATARKASSSAAE